MLCFQLPTCQAVVWNEQISVEALAVKIEQGSAPLILDVRSPEEYAAGHILGAINIDYRDISDELETIRTFNPNQVVVYCEKGIRAAISQKQLTDAGFTPVTQLTGSFFAWRAANLPIVTTNTTRS